MVNPFACMCDHAYGTSAAMTRPSPFDAAHALLDSARRARTFPAWAAEVGSSEGVRWQARGGHLTFDADAPAATPATLYDLASLTKPLATASLLIELIEQQRLSLDTLVSAHLPAWRGPDRASVTVRDLLEHAGGLSARLAAAPPDSVPGFEHEICTMPLECEPRTRALYSDLGFILLALLAERAGAQVFDRQVTTLLDRALDHEPGRRVDDHIVTSVAQADRPLAAPTVAMDEDARRGARLQGVVHDNYAALLGGHSGHAGLFGTASGVGRVARLLLRAARGIEAGPGAFGSAAVTRLLVKSEVPGSSRALGWDTMLPTSSCGSQLSASAFGHVGFTGTSLWIDPAHDRYYILLTNRVCDGGTSDDMQRVRRAFHDTVAGA